MHKPYQQVDVKTSRHEQQKGLKPIPSEFYPAGDEGTRMLLLNATVTARLKEFGYDTFGLRLP
jgi:hypothetical protein